MDPVLWGEETERVALRLKNNMGESALPLCVLYQLYQCAVLVCCVSVSVLCLLSQCAVSVCCVSVVYQCAVSVCLCQCVSVSVVLSAVSVLSFPYSHLHHSSPLWILDLSVRLGALRSAGDWTDHLSTLRGYVKRKEFLRSSDMADKNRSTTQNNSNSNNNNSNNNNKSSSSNNNSNHSNYNNSDGDNHQPLSGDRDLIIDNLDAVKTHLSENLSALRRSANILNAKEKFSAMSEEYGRNKLVRSISLLFCWLLFCCFMFVYVHFFFIYFIFILVFYFCL